MPARAEEVCKMVKRDFGIDIVGDKVLCFVNAHRSTVVITRNGRLVPPVEIFPLRAQPGDSQKSGFLLVYRQRGPLCLATVRFSTVKDAQGREVPNWRACVMRNITFTGVNSFDAEELVDMFPYSIVFVALWDAVNGWCEKKVRHILEKYKTIA
jgi:hypothetical protein